MIIRPTTKFLLAESFKELSQKKSVDKITIKEITQNCELTSQTFYNHFRDKYDLIAWIYSTPIADIVNKIDNDRYTLQNSIADVVEYFCSNRDFLKNLIMNTSGQTSFINYVAKSHIKILSDYIKRTQKIESLPIDTKIFVKIYCYGTVCTLCELLIKPSSISTAELVKFFVDALPDPLQKYFMKN